MTSTADTAQLIHDRGVPLIYIDTCSVLDFIRGPRPQFLADHARSSMEILTLAEEKKVMIVLPQQVTVEIARHNAAVGQVGQAALDAANESLRQMAMIISHFGTPTAAPLPVSSNDYALVSQAVLDRFLQVANVADTTPEATARADDRVDNAVAPSRLGKASREDCIVIESCFETLSAARTLGFAEPAFFVSANHRDYMQSVNGAKVLHPQLVHDFGSRGLEYWVDFFGLRYTPAIQTL